MRLNRRTHRYVHRTLSVVAHITESQTYRRRWAVLIAAILAVTVSVGTVIFRAADGRADDYSAAMQTNSSNTRSSSGSGVVSKNEIPEAAQPSAQTALTGIAGLDGTAQISTSGFTLDSTSQMQLEQELSVFASYGYSASFVLVDMATGDALASYGDTASYSASAIKGPYIISLAATGTIDLDAVYQGATDADAATQQLIDQTITVSNNDTYSTLYNEYGSEPFSQWSAQADVGVDVTTGPYLYISAIDMARMWAQDYGYLFDGDAGTAGDTATRAAATGDAADGAATVASDESRQWLAGEFGDTLNSSIHMALGEEYSVYTKAGWINGEGDYYALNDAGIVSSSSGDYVLAVLTDACGEYDLLTGLISLLDSIHSSSMSA